jgi:hypothetical protein
VSIETTVSVGVTEGVVVTVDTREASSGGVIMPVGDTTTLGVIGVVYVMVVWARSIAL